MRQLTLREAALERLIADFLSLDNWLCRHIELNFSERKLRAVGERGMPDLMCVRYHDQPHRANILWIECKRSHGRYSLEQIQWAIRERFRGATVLQMGIDFEASLEGFISWYQRSGLERRQVRIGGIQQHKVG